MHSSFPLSQKPTFRNPNLIKNGTKKKKGHSTVIWTKNFKIKIVCFTQIIDKFKIILVIVYENDKQCLLPVVVYA